MHIWKVFSSFSYFLDGRAWGLLRICCLPHILTTLLLLTHGLKYSCPVHRYLYISKPRRWKDWIFPCSKSVFTDLTVWSLETAKLLPAPQEGNLDVERRKGELLLTNHFLQLPPLRAEYLALEKLFNPTLGNWCSSGKMLLFISIAFSCFFIPSLPSPAAAK